MSTQASSTHRFSTLALRLGLSAAVLGSSAALVTHASAAVITFATPISVPNTFDGVYINFLSGATATLGSGVAGWDFNPYNSGTSLSFFWSATPSQASGVASTTTGPYLDLGVGSVISSASTFAQVTATANTASFQTVGTHVLGFRFYNETTALINYGYATLVSGGSTGFPLTITRWSFDNAGAAITVVPEPAPGLMFSFGAMALGALRWRQARRRQGR